MLRPLPVILIILWLGTLPARAHEFWIEPHEYQVDIGQPLVADLRNGQEFDGVIHAYFDKRTARFDLLQNGKTTAYTGRMGDVPALQTRPDAEGLLTLVYQSAPQRLTYESWDKFAAFAAHKDFPEIRSRHLSRGLPDSGFSEIYTRYAKALIAVGDGRGQDAATGMETEFIARANPYTDDTSGGLPVQLLYQNAPRSDAQVEIFDRAPDGTVAITLTRTDAHGWATIPVTSGHSYLIDAVVLREAPADESAVWQSLWAAMTFAVP